MIVKLVHNPSSQTNLDAANDTGTMIPFLPRISNKNAICDNVEMALTPAEYFESTCSEEPGSEHLMPPLDRVQR